MAKPPTSPSANMLVSRARGAVSRGTAAARHLVHVVQHDAYALPYSVPDPAHVELRVRKNLNHFGAAYGALWLAFISVSVAFNASKLLLPLVLIAVLILMGATNVGSPTHAPPGHVLPVSAPQASGGGESGAGQDSAVLGVMRAALVAALCFYVVAAAGMVLSAPLAVAAGITAAHAVVRDAEEAPRRHAGAVEVGGGESAQVVTDSTLAYPVVGPAEATLDIDDDDVGEHRA